MEEERNEKSQLLFNKTEKTLVSGGNLPISEAGLLNHGIVAHGPQLTEMR